MTAAAKIDALIREAERWRLYHKQRGALGYIEAIGCDIRIKALKDAKEAIENV
jgi:hypothetical protein